MDDVREIIQQVIQEIFESNKPTKRFRASIYYDVIVPDTGDLEADREVAKSIVDEDRKKMNNMETYIGGVAHRPFGQFMDQSEIDRL